MLDESRDIVGEEEVGGGRDEDSTAVGGRNVATAGVLGATSCIPNYLPYGRGWTQSHQEGWRQNLIKRPHHNLKEKYQQ